MLQRAILLLLAVTLSAALAVPAVAGEKVEGDGYSIRLPDGFTEAMSIENQGRFKVTSRFGNLPTDGMPELKAYTFGPEVQPQAVIVLARVNLTRSITTTDELGMENVEAMRDQLPEGMTVTVRKIGEYHAIEMGMVNELMDEDQAVKVLSVACGDYIVVVMLMTMGEDFAAPDIVWGTMVSSLKIERGMNKVLLYGGVGLGALVLLTLLRRRGSRDLGSRHSPRLNRYQPRGDDLRADSAPGANALPRTLPPRGALNSPGSSPTLPPQGAAASPPASPVHAGSAASPAEKRSLGGLRSTLPPSGRWGQ